MNKDKNIRDEIARVAYGLYEKRGFAPGKDLSDWIEAEKIVKQKYSKGAVGEVNPVKKTRPVSALESAKSKSRGLIQRPSTR